nr:immunoglobulin light chain junction region [Macaca mulatta]MOW66295.1 immunoglobulin light chain junction region [Macaca mulatta]MOW66321.1 immunoglobulin light chain junction region [Macaca mulatta]MOW66343.1 immunoglobulin light chain junction region [Macaca mulatta]MOW66424.1 immunoglobulin light chain junction region [Macaca mulatta]
DYYCAIWHISAWVF